MSLQVIACLKVAVASLFGWHMAPYHFYCIVWQEQACSRLKDDMKTTGRLQLLDFCLMPFVTMSPFGPLALPTRLGNVAY